MVGFPKEVITDAAFQKAMTSIGTVVLAESKDDAAVQGAISVLSDTTGPCPNVAAKFQSGGGWSLLDSAKRTLLRRSIDAGLTGS